MKSLTLIFCLFACLGMGQHPKSVEKKLTPNEIVLKEALACVGYKVSGGTCEQYVSRCLNKVTTGWRTKYGYRKGHKLFNQQRKFVYGRILNKNEVVLPGDIIRFFWVFNDEIEISHHVGVIKEVKGKQYYTILDQNAADVQYSYVDEWDFDQSKFKVKGEVVIYRPY